MGAVRDGDQKPSTSGRVKLAVWVGVSVLLAGLALYNALTNILRSVNPVAAIALNADPEALAVVNDAMLDQLEMKDYSGSFRAASTQSLTGSVLNSRALRQMALMAKVDGDNRTYAKLLALSQSVSRRDQRTQILLMKDALLAQKMKEGLSHWDMVLRTTAGIRQTMYAQMTPLIIVPQVREILADFMKEKAIWSAEFFAFAAVTAQSPDDVAKLGLLTPELMKSPEYKVGTTILVKRLVDLGSPSLAQDFFLATRLADPGLTKSIEFTRASISGKSPPLTWEVFESGDLSTGFILAANGKYKLVSNAFSGTSGTIARKAVFLTPGTYEFRAKIDLSKAAERSVLNVALTCIDSKGGRSATWNASLTNGITADQFSVPVGCAGQVIELSYAAGERQQESEFSIGGLQVKKVS